MPRVDVPGFIGPSNTLRSITQDCDRTINWFLEATAPGTGKAPASLQATPGLAVWTVLPDQPVRALIDSGTGRFFALAGATFFELFSDGTYLANATAVANDTLIISWASNGSAGHQIILISDGLGYIYDLNADTLTQITDGDFPANVRTVDFMDGYFIVQQGAGSRLIAWSALEDGTTWDPLDVAERSEASDNLAALIRNHREIWLFGGLTSEVWWDSGDPTAIFQPLQGVFLEYGLQARFTLRRFNDTLIWMLQDANGAAQVAIANGYRADTTVSRFAVPTQLQLGDTPTDAIALTFQMNGHLFYALTLPRSDRTWLYDVTMNVWTEWNLWNSTTCEWQPKPISTHLFAFDTHLMGDLYSGAIYRCAMDIYNEQIVSPT